LSGEVDTARRVNTLYAKPQRMAGHVSGFAGDGPDQSGLIVANVQTEKSC
jgi:hypothetical protein